MTIAFAVAGFALAIAIDRAISMNGRTLVIAPLVVFAAARAVIRWFPMAAPRVLEAVPGTAAAP